MLGLEHRTSTPALITPGLSSPLAHQSQFRAPRREVPCFLCVDEWEGEPTGAEGQELEWVTAPDLSRKKMPDADLPLLPDVKRAMQESAMMNWNNWN